MVRRGTGSVRFPSCMARRGAAVSVGPIGFIRSYARTELDEGRPQCKLVRMLNMTTWSRYAYCVKEKDNLRPEKNIALRNVRHRRRGAAHTHTHAPSHNRHTLTHTHTHQCFKPVKIKTMNSLQQTKTYSDGRIHSFFILTHPTLSNLEIFFF